MSKLNDPTDPDTIEVKADAALLQKAEKCVAFMQENEISDMCFQWEFGWTFFELAVNLDDEDKKGQKIVFRQDSQAYVEFEPKDCLDGHAKVYKDGNIEALLPFKDSSNELWCSLGNVVDLKLKIAEMNNVPAKPNGPSLGM